MNLPLIILIGIAVLFVWAVRSMFKDADTRYRGLFLINRCWEEGETCYDLERIIILHNRLVRLRKYVFRSMEATYYIVRLWERYNTIKALQNSEGFMRSYSSLEKENKVLRFLYEEFRDGNPKIRTVDEAIEKTLELEEKLTNPKEGEGHENF